MPRALSQNSAFTVKFPKILHSWPRTSSLCCMNSKGQSAVVRMFLVILDVAEAILCSPRWMLWEAALLVFKVLWTAGPGRCSAAPHLAMASGPSGQKWQEMCKKYLYSSSTAVLGPCCLKGLLVTMNTTSLSVWTGDRFILPTQTQTLLPGDIMGISN